MLFNSFHFLIFFIVVFLIYFNVSTRWQWLVLFISSCIFYADFVPKYLLILFAIILIDYFAGIAIEKKQGLPRKWILWISILANLSILIYFKYFNFIIENLALYFKSLDGLLLHVVLPIGLSFHVFQSLSYTIEVYRGHQKAERHLGIYAVYVLYFPQLVAGPIERPQNLLSQFHKSHQFDLERWYSGLGLIFAGLFKKVVVADTLSLLSNQVFKDPSGYGAFSLWIALTFFGFQIYCDFSGYSDIARGVSRILGIELMKNFDHPYWSTSIGEFWRRWHISLSTWFRDYVYIPLGGGQISSISKARNIMTVFLLSGLWHGAQWNFLIWGCIHGIAITIENSLLYRLILKQRWIGRIWCLAVIFYSWVFFRAANFQDAINFSRGLFSEPTKGFIFLKNHELSEAIFVLAMLLIFEKIQEKYNLWTKIISSPTILRDVCIGALTFIFLVFGQFGKNSFIYFQF